MAFLFYIYLRSAIFLSKHLANILKNK